MCRVSFRGSSAMRHDGCELVNSDQKPELRMQSRPRLQSWCPQLFLLLGLVWLDCRWFLMLRQAVTDGISAMPRVGHVSAATAFWTTSITLAVWNIAGIAAYILRPLYEPLFGGVVRASFDRKVVHWKTKYGVHWSGTLLQDRFEYSVSGAILSLTVWVPDRRFVLVFHSAEFGFDQLKVAKSYLDLVRGGPLSPA